MDDGRAAEGTRCATVLTALSDERRELIAIRLNWWWPDLVEGLTTVTAPSELAHHNGQSPVRAGYHFQRRRAPTRC